MGLNYSIIRLSEVDSTNIYAKNQARMNAPEGTVIIADHQSGGYGRMGRHFSSPEGTGLYFSIILRPDIPARDALLITTAAAVSVAESIDSFNVTESQIKWVNDIYNKDNKKLCGILCESALAGDRLDYAVLGIGINLTEPKGGFPDNIKDIAGAVFSKYKEEYKELLLERVLKRFDHYYCELQSREFYNIYYEKCFIIGKEVNFIKGNEITPCRVLDLDNDFRLIVQSEDGKRLSLDSGEISVKLRS